LIQGAHTIAGGLKWEQGAEPPGPLTLTTGYRTTNLGTALDRGACRYVSEPKSQGHSVIKC